MADNPFQMMNEIEGFPVVTRQFEHGRATEETALKSATREALDDELFAPPAGYEEIDPFSQGRR